MPNLIQQSVVLPSPSERFYDMYLDPAARAAFTGARIYRDPWRAHFSKNA